MIYLALTIFSSFLMLIRTIIFATVGWKAARDIHINMIQALVKAPINTFYDVTPTGRILNRLSKDQADIDSSLIFSFGGTLALGF